MNPPPISRPALIRQSSVTSSRNSSNAVQDKFAELRDAAFYNTDVPGFLLSADEKLCYPYVYSGKVPEDPVEVEEVDAYFLENWDLWDEDHTRKLTIEEYPAIILSRERKPFQHMRIGILRDGQRGVYECRGQPLYSPGTAGFIGGIVYVVEIGSLEEVQARKAEEQLRSFEAICDSLPHIVWSGDASGKIDYFSRAWYEYSGLSEQESMGHGWRQAMHPDDRAESWQALNTAGKNTGQTDSTYRCRRRDGVYRWFHARAAPKLDAEGNIIRYYGTSTDVHDTIMAKEEARKLERENARLISTENAAREGSRMKSQFLAHMSHELRTPIAGIIGMVSLLWDTRLSIDQADYADCIKTSAQNLLTIVNDVLDFSKIESGRLEIEEIQFDLTALVDDFRRVWTLMANQKGIAFNVTTNLASSLEIMGDPTRIGQILSNLVSIVRLVY
jgi:PAS domain S-box-containing protein